MNFSGTRVISELSPPTLATALCLSFLSLEAENLPSHFRGWESLPAMPTARSEIACAAIGPRIYVVGGIGLDGSKRAFEAYDTNTGSWEKLAPLPTKLNHSGVAAWGDSVYVSGGFLDLRQNHFSSRLYVYEVGNDSWKDLGPMPEFRYKHFMIARDGWLHLIGGLHLREIWSYHIASGKWRTDLLSPLPECRDHTVVLQDSAYLYVVGGRNDRVAMADCWRYDFRSGHWSVFAKLPIPRGAPAAVLHRGRIHVVGGEDLITQTVSRRYDILDLRNGEWSVGKPMPLPRHGMTSARMGDTWIVIGGGRRAEIGTVFTATRATEAITLVAD